MKIKALIVLLIGLLLIWLLLPTAEVAIDPILDTPYRPTGGSDKMGWSVGFTWMGDPEQVRDDVKSGGWDVRTSAAGGFSFTLPLDEFALNLLGDTEVRIYLDGEEQFWGYVKKIDIDEAQNVVNVTGGDMMERMGLRNVDYQSVTASGADPPRGDQGSKAVFDNMIHWYTGETSSDSMFNKEFVEWSETSYRYTYDGNTLLDALVNVAKSSSLTVGGKKNIGYAFWIDGKGNIYCQPYGWRSYDKEIPGFWKLGLDYGPIRNRVHIRGGKPEAWELIETGSQEWVSDGCEDQTDWTLVLNGASGTKAESLDASIGDKSLMIDTWAIDQAQGPITLTRTLGTALDWSFIDEGGNIQPLIRSMRIYVKIASDCAGNCGQGSVYLKFGNDAGNYIRIPIFIDETLSESHSQTWIKVLAGPDSTDWSEVGTVDWSVIDWFQIQMEETGVAFVFGTNYILFDGLTAFFKKIDLWRKDSVSIGTHGLKEAKFQDSRVTDWKTAETVAENILELLKCPSVTASVTIPYYDPDLKLNDLVTPVVKGVEWPLYVNGLSVKWAGDHVSTSITVGRPVPDEDDILMSMHILRDQDQEQDGYNFRAADTYEDSTCMKDKERYCRNDCQVSNCQNAAQLESCFTFQERNPCITTCQRYKERTGWLNRIIDQ